MSNVIHAEDRFRHDNPPRIEGLEADWVVFDECLLIDEDIFEKIIALMKRNGMI